MEKTKIFDESKIQRIKNNANNFQTDTPGVLGEIP